MPWTVGEGAFCERYVNYGVGRTVGGMAWSDDENYLNANRWEWYGMNAENRARVYNIMRSPRPDGDYDTQMFYCHLQAQ